MEKEKKKKRLQWKVKIRNIYSSLFQGTVSKNMLHLKKKSLLKCHSGSAKLSNEKASFLKVAWELNEYMAPPFPKHIDLVVFRAENYFWRNIELE